MTKYIDFESINPSTGLGQFDVIIIGGGPAGLTICKELSSIGVKIAVIESGAMEQSREHEALNEVEAIGALNDLAVMDNRTKFHAQQLPYWSSEVQRYGVRCRVLGGSTAGWAGKVAPFDEIDYETRDWVPGSGWPVTRDDMAQWITRAAQVLDLGPILNDAAFWVETGRKPPEELTTMPAVQSYFWQFARSQHTMMDVKRFGEDFRREDLPGVTVFYNATCARILTEEGSVEGVDVISSLTGKVRGRVHATQVVLSAGAIENGRLLLISAGQCGFGGESENGMVGRFLMDHPCVSLGDFAPETLNAPAQLLGFFGLQSNYRAFMYSHGLALTPETQRKHLLPNMAVFSNPKISDDDPLLALRRLLVRTSENWRRDIGLVLSSPVQVGSSIGRKILENPRVPARVRRVIADIAVWMNANFVAKNYVSKGAGRKIEQLTIELISEHPPDERNRIFLSTETDRLGLPLAKANWEISTEHRRAILCAAAIITEGFEAAGLTGFRPVKAVADNDPGALLIRDMAHTAGTMRMGADPATSVVDPECQVHGIKGLHVAGASIFPTSGHANPTMVIIAFALRLAESLKKSIRTDKVNGLAAGCLDMTAATKPKILVTGATGNLGTEVVSELLAQGFAVRGQFRNRVPDHPRVQWRQVDFGDTDLTNAHLEDLVEGVTGVIHLAASLVDPPEKMEVTNVTNLERFAKVCAAKGVLYFGQASSMVVYGSPRVKIVTEETPSIDLKSPLHKQYYSDRQMLDYARSKKLGEDILIGFAGKMHVDIYRIAVAQSQKWLEASLDWSRGRQLFSMYRNTHFVSRRNVARAIVHLLQHALDNDVTDIEIYNIADKNSPTFKEVCQAAGRRPGPSIPWFFDVLNGIKIGKSAMLRYPHGAFRMDDSKLKATGFELER